MDSKQEVNFLTARYEIEGEVLTGQEIWDNNEHCPFVESVLVIAFETGSFKGYHETDITRVLPVGDRS